MVKLSHNNGLYLLGSLQGFYVPVGADRTADLTSWKAIADRGEPLRADARAVAASLATGGDACLTGPRERAPGTAVVRTTVPSWCCTATPKWDASETRPGGAPSRLRLRRPATLLGLPLVQARIRTEGGGGNLAARLWDVHDGRQLLISGGVYRLEDAQRGPASSSSGTACGCAAGTW